jgi:hypothetical protein
MFPGCQSLARLSPDDAGQVRALMGAAAQTVHTARQCLTRQETAMLLRKTGETAFCLNPAPLARIA